jgi:hypothetical protein
MKRIDEYVNSVYAHIDGNEAKELKEEMRVHLLEAVEELKAEGKLEEEAVSVALERFGDERMLKGRVAEYFQVPYIFSVNLLRTAIVFAITALLIGGLFAFNWLRQNDQEERVMQSALSVLKANHEISEADKKLIVEYSSSEAPQIKTLEIRPYSADVKDKEGFTYHNPKPFKHIMYWNGMAGRAASNGTWVVDIGYEHFELAWINAIVVCLVVYWVLFAIWAMIQAYRNRRLHVLWLVAFSLFNVPAYIIYRSSMR